MAEQATLADLAETLRGRQVDRGTSAYPRFSVDLMRRSEFTLRARSGLMHRSKLRTRVAKRVIRLPRRRERAVRVEW
jgi:hypothetical protein